MSSIDVTAVPALPGAGVLSTDRLSRFATRTAIEAIGECWTYRDLDQASRGVASALCCPPSDPGGTVCIVGFRDPGLIVAILGAVRAGRPFVILDPDRKSP